ncbi:hypothetical protein AZI86_06950 [Bdellovibrio bacteriovorus]|uniref:VOC domain-containing protein n=1 Tax=Bdellovibrio bacteriovorus TaxID=959 RepID=A0A150WQJ6_BDEBC|nr:hypothetical protein [Bdellovibrio bacteriovorus]KYG66773.1 hypothetical protein AZI86_06950 [Bdellovibrio bacteriovorus]
MKKHPFQNFTIDHTTMLFHPKLYIMSYVVFRIIFGTTPEDLLYEKKRKGKDGQKDVSMTYATRLGEWQPKEKNDPLNTIFALVQPSEPAGTPSHVRTMLEGHDAVAHVQHLALRTPDLIAFHKHCVERGVQFVTPILKDDHENLIQVFSGEWFLPGSKSSGFFFEFLQRDPSDSELATIQKANKQSWFRDETFLGLYDEKEREYQSGNVLSFFKKDLFEAILAKVGDKQVYEITETDLEQIETMMIEMTAKANKT